MSPTPTPADTAMLVDESPVPHEPGEIPLRADRGRPGPQPARRRGGRGRRPTTTTSGLKARVASTSSRGHFAGFTGQDVFTTIPTPLLEGGGDCCKDVEKKTSSRKGSMYFVIHTMIGFRSGQRYYLSTQYAKTKTVQHRKLGKLGKVNYSLGRQILFTNIQLDDFSLTLTRFLERIKIE
ncbi:hypothetical protein K503DRAFT_783323 [Rhizopogon vinicolor AM-OR11-026]|uniref:Uncharacterized protein n=1 Tax=Rhizopogon vinicolor AM-OR11-026 TaxID=1314800 RepID=A0A1B7MZ16_9AGAM|nr:hypothetical protein K503DRAFT_783323 [Rhizopogon vinicolor AM-OR11-026]